MEHTKNNGQISRIGDFFDSSIYEAVRRCFVDYVESEIIPLLGIYCRGDPLQTYTTKEVADLLQTSESSVRRLEKGGKLRAMRLSDGKRSSLRFRRVDIEQYQLNQLK